MADVNQPKDPDATPEEGGEEKINIGRRDACKAIGALAALFGASVVGCGRAVGPEGCRPAPGPDAGVEGCDAGPEGCDAGSAFAKNEEEKPEDERA